MKFKRLQALVLAVAMTLSVPSGTFPAYAEPAAPDTGLCSHHPEHTATCGYQEAVEESPCTHVHDENCGFREAQEEIPCNKGCTDTDGDGQINHVSGCAYQPAVEGSLCTHAHGEACRISGSAAGDALRVRLSSVRLHLHKPVHG